MSAIPHAQTEYHTTPQTPAPTGDRTSPQLHPSDFSLHPSDFSLPAPRKLADIQSQIAAAGHTLDALLTQSDLTKAEAEELLTSQKYKSHRQHRCV